MSSMNAANLALLAESLDLGGVAMPEALASLPGVPAVYLLVDAEKTPIQLATTQHLRRAVTSRLSRPDASTPSKRAELSGIVASVRWRPVTCVFEAAWVYYRLARELHPTDYLDRIAFGPAWFLHADWSRPVAEIRVTDRIWRTPGEFVGPWPTQRAAQQALEGLWDLFDLCREPEQVRRAPAGQRCAYADMGRCDAPCDGTAPLVPYTDRVRQAWKLAVDGPDAWLLDADARMRAAAAAQQYERAALLKKQIEFARKWAVATAPGVLHDSAMQFVLAFPVTRRRAWAMFLFRFGGLEAGPAIANRRLTQELEPWLRTATTRTLVEADEIRMHQTWLFSRWLARRGSDACVFVQIQPGEDAASLAGRVQVEARALDERRAKDASSTNGVVAEQAE
ncbi:MAG: hypothetical protein HZB38_12625 [Planctomycetes bacterium]|nr:hypothetical protein [Planctomycetota bacterium]